MKMPTSDAAKSREADASSGSENYNHVSGLRSEEGCDRWVFTHSLRQKLRNSSQNASQEEEHQSASRKFLKGSTLMN
jgi:hypothetical protein